MNILGLIPAREGSQRNPNKNIRLLAGKPLIAYTINSASKSKYINRIIVSSDSREIMRISKLHGAETPFQRPKEIAQTNSTEFEFIMHALEWLRKNEKYEPDLIVLLYPTSPFRKAETIDKAIDEILRHPEADSLRSIRLCSEHPYKMWHIENGYLKPFIKSGDTNTQTLSYQLLPTIYIQNASIYIIRTSTIMNKKSTIGDIVIPFIMNEQESIDINTEIDFGMADAILNKTSGN
jgi:CMP-N,N'-diacetyllegionaminic acid synthase